MADQPSFATLCARAGGGQPPVETLPISPPIYQSSVFHVGDLANVEALCSGTTPGFIYSRDANPTVRLLEETAARLEGAEDALATASGMGAIAAALLGDLETGDHVVAADVLYGRTLTLLRDDLTRLGIKTAFVDTRDLDAVERAFEPRTRLVFVETISNPLMRVADIPNLAAIARRHGARLWVDHTFATPFLYQPLAHGADVVCHSGTKYLGGHSDVTCGVVAADRTTISRGRRRAVTLGMTLGPFEAWLTLRGVKTLALRMARACDNAFEVAQFLSAQPSVMIVHYPGLPEHPNRPLAERLFAGRFGAMLAFELAGGWEAADAFIRRVQNIPFAPSLGDVATTLSHPASTSHRGLPPEERRRLGISDGLIRLSVGIEDAADIIEDLRRGLGAS